MWSIKLIIVFLAHLNGCGWLNSSEEIVGVVWNHWKTESSAGKGQHWITNLKQVNAKHELQFTIHRQNLQAKESGIRLCLLLAGSLYLVLSSCPTALRISSAYIPAFHSAIRRLSSPLQEARGWRRIQRNIGSWARRWGELEAENNQQIVKIWMEIG